MDIPTMTARPTYKVSRTWRGWQVVGVYTVSSGKRVEVAEGWCFFRKRSAVALATRFNGIALVARHAAEVAVGVEDERRELRRVVDATPVLSSGDWVTVVTALEDGAVVCESCWDVEPGHAASIVERRSELGERLEGFRPVSG